MASMGANGSKGKYKIGPKVRAFFEAYRGAAKMNALEAARMAGYTAPGAASMAIKRHFPEKIAQLEREYRESFKLSDEELDGILTTIAKNPEHKDQLKAVELISRMKGRLNDKITVNIDRKTAQKELDEVLAAINALAASQEADSTARWPKAS